MNPDPLIDAPEPEVRRKRRIGLVWLIPIVAAVIAAGLAVDAIRSRGPTITIFFSSAEGLEAGKTRIKYKDVDVGKVTAIQLSQDLDKVVVTAEMVREMAPYLTRNTRFWAVRAQVSAGQVTGLTTLFSGVYIGMDPGKPEGVEQHRFQALDSPPVVTMDMPGRYYNLRSEGLGGLDIGSPVFFRQIDVGQVVSYEIDATGQALLMRIFVRAPYDRYVTEQTRFWNASGLDVSLDASGVQINLETVMTLLAGGIAFDTPPDIEPGAPAAEDTTFRLYSRRGLINEPDISNRMLLVTYFSESVRGLEVGAPVEFRGIKVGEVTGIRLEFNADTLAFQIPVILGIDPARLAMVGTESVDGQDVMSKLVQKGLRAQLRTGLLITGQQFVSLNFFPDARPAELTQQGPYLVLPSVASPFDEFTASMGRLLSRLEDLPMEKIAKDLQSSVGEVRNFLTSKDLTQAMSALNQSLTQLQDFTGTLNTQTGPQIAEVIAKTQQTLEKAQLTLGSADRLMSAESPLTYQMQQAMTELTRAARAVGALADFLERNPEALIFGR
jgi:paraquat-inducible protein B